MKKAFTFALALLATMSAWAQTTFTVDNLKYTVTDETAKTVRLSGYVTKPEGTLDIPATVTNNGTEYSVTSIGDRAAFMYCTELTQVNIPNSVISIGYGIFYGCSKLTQVNIPNSVTSIGRLTFYDTALYNNAENWTNNVLYIDNCLIEAKTELSGSYEITAGTRLIAENAFSECISLTQVNIPDGVTNIGSGAFGGCSYLKQVNIPNSVINIGSSAFSRCYALMQVNIPNSVTNIGERVFYNCKALTEINVDDANTAYSSENGVLFDKNKTTLIQYPANKQETTYIIPDGVTNIGDYAFYACSTLTQVTIPSSVASIGNEAFYECYSITQVTWNAINCADFTPYDIGSSYKYGPFYDSRSNITVFTFGDQVEHIPSYLCYQMSTLRQVTIPNIVKSIGNYSFCKCSKLTQVTIGNNVARIEYDAFAYCSALTAVYYTGDVAGWCAITFDTYSSNPLSCAHKLYIDNTLVTRLIIPDSINEIKNYTFSGCNALRQVTIPNIVKSIGNYSFCECSKLTQVTIGNSVKSIGKGAFSDCSTLAEMTVLATVPPTAGWKAFDGVNSNIPVYVPAEALEDYWAANVWEDFINLQAMQTDLQTPSIPESITVYGGTLHNPQGLPVSLYDMQGRMVYSGTAATVSQPAGVYVVRCAGASGKVLF